MLTATAYISLLISLLIESLYDIRQLRVPWWCLGISGLMGLCLCVCRLINAENIIVYQLIALLPGIGLTLLSLSGGAHIGLADGLLFIILGLALSPYNYLMTLGIIAVITIIVSIIVMLTNTKNPSILHTRIPYVPLITMGTIIGALLEAV